MSTFWISTRCWLTTLHLSKTSSFPFRTTLCKLTTLSQRNDDIIMISTSIAALRWIRWLYNFACPWSFVQYLQSSRDSESVRFQEVPLSGQGWGAQLVLVKQMDAQANNTWEQAMTNNTRYAKRVVKDIKQMGDSFASLRLINMGSDKAEAIVTFEGPLHSPYRTGIFQLGFAYSEKYPIGPPKVHFLTRVYHPNIDHTGEICIDILTKRGWNPSLCTRTVVTSIISLLSDPIVDDPLVPEIALTYIRSREDYKHIAAAYTRRHATLDAALDRLSKVSTQILV